MGTIKEVAKLAGVSIGTVSNVVHNRNCVSPKLRQRVLEAMEQCGYQLDISSSAAKSGKVSTVGLILPQIDRLFFPQIVEGILNITEKQGYQVTILISGNNPETEKQHIKTMLSSHVAGVLLSSAEQEENRSYFEELAQLSRTRMPIVMLERDYTAMGLDSVYIDNYRGAYQATRHLLDCGATKIVHLATNPNLNWGMDRYRGYRHALDQARNSYRLVERNIRNFDDSYHFVMGLLERGEEFDGIFAATDVMALGALKALYKHGISVPEQVQIMGFDDIFISSVTSPPLSSVHVYPKTLGEEACRMLLERVVLPQPQPIAREIPASVELRDTTREKDNP